MKDAEKVLFYDEITIDNDDYRFDGLLWLSNQLDMVV